MKKNRLIMLVVTGLLSLTTLAQKVTQNCAVIVGVNRENIYVGNNEDWLHPFTSVFCYPASEGKFGRIMFGFSFTESNQGYCGGMNEKGLFIDGLGISNTRWKADSSKKSLGTISEFNGNLESYILEKFGSVDQVISFFNEYNIIHLTTGKFLIADKSGASIVVEWGQNKMQILKREGDFQIATNFVQSNYKKGEYPSYRYNLAEKIFNNSKDHITINKVKEILSAVHWEETEDHPTTTVYSYICDLKKGDIYVYNFHNYEAEVKLNIDNELKKGEQIHPLVTLFPYETYSENIWKNKKVVSILVDKITNEGFDGDNGFFNTINHWKNSQIFNFYTISEEQIVEIADKLKDKGKYSDAIKVCKYGINKYSNSVTLQNKLSMIYYYSGDFDSAIESFKNILANNPDNINAKWYVEYIEALNNSNLVDVKNFESITGQYGERKLFIENGKLFYQYGTGTKRELVPMKDNVYVLKDIDYFRIRVIKKDNQSEAIEGVYLDGRNYLYEKSL